ncbi:MAG TPA: hypothetical protein VIM84_14095 [Gemmatimonadales bacterium]
MDFKGLPLGDAGGGHGSPYGLVLVMIVGEYRIGAPGFDVRPDSHRAGSRFDERIVRQAVGRKTRQGAPYTGGAHPSSRRERPVIDVRLPPLEFQPVGVSAFDDVAADAA